MFNTESMTIMNIYVENNIKIYEAEMSENSSSVVVGYLTKRLSLSDRTIRQKIQGT
jgi:hypothetical protein